MKLLSKLCLSAFVAAAVALVGPSAVSASSGAPKHACKPTYCTHKPAPAKHKAAKVYSPKMHSDASQMKAPAAPKAHGKTTHVQQPAKYCPPKKAKPAPKPKPCNCQKPKTQVKQHPRPPTPHKPVVKPKPKPKPHHHVVKPKPKHHQSQPPRKVVVVKNFNLNYAPVSVYVPVSVTNVVENFVTVSQSQSQSQSQAQAQSQVMLAGASNGGGQKTIGAPQTLPDAGPGASSMLLVFGGLAGLFYGRRLFAGLNS